jgi:flavin-dependent dehydrogenase
MALVGRKREAGHQLAQAGKKGESALRLGDGARVAVIGGGPAGSFFSHFFLDMASMIDLDVKLDIYEPRDYSRPGPVGCNNCGGIVSESLVQHLATEGINLPDSVVQRGLDSYVLHTVDGSVVHIDTPQSEKRIAAVHRGAGPRDQEQARWRSFDGYLQELAAGKGANIVRKRVADVSRRDGRLQVKTRDEESETYDFLVVAVGVNSPVLKVFGGLGLEYRPPRTSKTYICELRLGEEKVAEYLGSSMHVLLLNMPRLEFSALIPKGDYVTVCLLGEDIDAPLVKRFLESPQVKACFPSDFEIPENLCHCSPRINVRGAVGPFADRIVFIGDSGVTRLYKDGIGAAYRTAKAAAVTAILEGVAAEDFRRRFWPTCRSLGTDNRVGELVFQVTRVIQKLGPVRRGMVRMVEKEQRKKGAPPHMSMVLWDMFTGSAPYRDIFLRTVRPGFVSRLIWNSALAAFSKTRTATEES